MKRVFTLIAVALVTAIGFNNTAIAQTQVEEGNIIIDPYYGGPNFGRALLTSLEGTVENSAVSGIGPAGLRAEYLLADNFGLGIDFIYNSTSVSGTTDSLNTDGTVFETYDTKVFSRRYRIHLRANYHFAQTDALDAYVGFGAGTNIRSIGFTTDDPNFDGDSATGSLIPFSIRIALGTRYYFTDNIGLNVELGLGGPVVSGGLSFKF